MKLQGPNNDFKINLKSIYAGYLLEKSDFTSYYLILALKQGFTLGKTLYKYVALSINSQINDSLEINQNVISKLSTKVKAIYNKKL